MPGKPKRDISEGGSDDLKPHDETPIHRNSRTLARLGAVQALYQMDMTGIGLSDVIKEYEDHRLGAEIDDMPLAKADKRFFADLLRGVVEDQRAIDPLIEAHLAAGWKLKRIDSILRAILRSGAYELKFRQDVPPRVVISEYIDLAHSFFDGEEPKVVNGILDKLARQFRDGLSGKEAAAVKD